ncbi:MAG: ribonuclease HII [Verrucomicrobia bacterium]|nr:MAG: ribonuclease HII [Verrucomicrobiota bacterium]
MKRSVSQATVDLFEFEKKLSARQLVRIAGVDEAGRGPLAGPVAAAAVVLPSVWYQQGLPVALRGLNDSKQLTESERERFYELIISSSEVEFAISLVEADEIDRINILRASLLAMNRALRQLRSTPDHVLVDGNQKTSTEWDQTAVVKGDSRSYSIAAASVLAKVTRDRVMLEHDGRYPCYGFASHKGYGTPQHLAALAVHGPCPIHRRSFAPLRPVNLELF